MESLDHPALLRSDWSYLRQLPPTPHRFFNGRCVSTENLGPMTCVIKLSLDVSNNETSRIERVRPISVQYEVVIVFIYTTLHEETLPNATRSICWSISDKDLH